MILAVCGRGDGVNLYVVGIFHTRPLNLNRHFDVYSPPSVFCSPSLIHPSNLLHVAPLCAPVIRCNEKCFQNVSHLPCDANWVSVWYSQRREQSSLTAESAEEREKIEEHLVFQLWVESRQQSTSDMCLHQPSTTDSPAVSKTQSNERKYHLH